jgi:cytochrome c2
MSQRVLGTVLILLVVCIAAVAAEKNMGAASLVIPGGNKGDVTLPHQTHQTVLNDCEKCHNLFPRQAGAITALKENGDLKKMQVMRECQACHREMAKAGSKTGPTRCDGCHQK